MVGDLALEIFQSQRQSRGKTIAGACLRRLSAVIKALRVALLGRLLAPNPKLALPHSQSHSLASTVDCRENHNFLAQFVTDSAGNAVPSLSQNPPAVNDDEGIGLHLALPHVLNVQPHLRVNPPFGVFLDALSDHDAVNDAIGLCGQLVNGKNRDWTCQERQESAQGDPGKDGASFRKITEHLHVGIYYKVEEIRNRRHRGQMIADEE